MSLAPNQQLFEYRIERVLGRGAFDTVCLAHNRFLPPSAARPYVGRWLSSGGKPGLVR